MDELWTFLGVAAMVVVRLAIPVAVTLGLGYWLRRLDQKWQAEAMSRQATALARETVAAQPQLQILGEEPEREPCWLVMNCDKQTRDLCPAYRNSQIPCWMARYLAIGRLSERCYTCRLFVPRRRQLA